MIIRTTIFPPPQSGLTSIVLFLFCLFLWSCESVENAEDIQALGTLTLDRAIFVQDVNPIFAGRACSDPGCHQAGTGPGGRLRINPNLDPVTDADTAEMDSNFASTLQFVNISSPVDSQLLTEPLRGNFGLFHAGGDIFTATSDSDYQTILAWISSPVAVTP